MARKAKYPNYLTIMPILACFVLGLYIVYNTIFSLTFPRRK